ncbi:MAG: hypothetical protein ACRD7E_02660 [Bryobacteraceae bacterium]
MRFPVNLSSEPFRRNRPMVVGSTDVGALLSLLLIVLVYLATGEREQAAESRDTIRRMEQQLRTLTAEQEKLEKVLLRPANAEVLQLSQFINELLMRKGVSWTRIFSDLEGVTPYNVRVMNVRPQINAQNDLLLDMTVGAESIEPILNFLMQMENSALFEAVTPHSWLPPSQTDPLYRYRVSVNYAQKL